MTQLEQPPSPEDVHKAFHGMLVRMRNYALHHYGAIGPRTLVALQNLDLFEEPVENHLGANMDLEVLRNPSHPRRVPLPPGPLLLYVTTDEKPKRMVVEIPVLLLSDLPDVRKAALDELERTIVAREMEITPKTQKTLEETRRQVVSDAPREWRSAAIALTDALGDDVLVALQGTRQSLECEPVIQDSLNTYAPRVFHPTVSSLDSITLDVRNPEREHQGMTEIVVSAVTNASSLREACERYYARLGYLPLAPAYSMAEVVSRWLAAHPDTNSWNEVWAWADDMQVPIPRYHACSVFILHPELVPAGKLPDLWREILEVVYDSDKKDEEGLEHEPWVLRRDLARHYEYHLEGNLPDNDGASIANFAWWFAERVATLFPKDPNSARYYRKNWVQAAGDRSAYIWLTASPHIERSYLRYVTATVAAPWATALLALMAGNLEHLANGVMSPEMSVMFHKALISCLVGSLPVSVTPVSDPTYAQECPLGQTALEWAARQPDDERKALEQLIATSRALDSKEGLCDALRKLSERSLSDQIAVALAMKAKACTDPAIAMAIWGVLSDAEWRQQVLGAVESRVLGLLIEGFILLQVDNGEKWFSQLPHFIAEMCEKFEDKDRCLQLFHYVIYTSLASDTVSAVRRLLHGSKKALIAEYAEDYRARVVSMWSQYPTWVQGRLRALLASLHVA